MVKTVQVVIILIAITTEKLCPSVVQCYPRSVDLYTSQYMYNVDSSMG